GCEAVTFHRTAAEPGLRYESLDFEAAFTIDIRGRQGDRSVRPHFQTVRVRAVVATSEPVAALAAVIEETEARCPVMNLLLDGRSVRLVPKVSEGKGSGVLDRGGGGPDLAGDPQHAAAQRRPGQAVRQPGGPSPRAAEGQALAQRGRHHGALGGAGGGTEERRRGVVDEVAVDLVGDDDQVVPGRDLAQRSDGGGLGGSAGGGVR